MSGPITSPSRNPAGFTGSTRPHIAGPLPQHLLDGVQKVLADDVGAVGRALGPVLLLDCGLQRGLVPLLHGGLLPVVPPVGKEVDFGGLAFDGGVVGVAALGALQKTKRESALPADGLPKGETGRSPDRPRSHGAQQMGPHLGALAVAEELAEDGFGVDAGIQFGLIAASRQGGRRRAEGASARRGAAKMTALGDVSSE